MKVITMTSSNRAQASESSQTPLNCTHLHEHAMHGPNTKPICKMKKMDVINNRESFQDSISQSSSSSKITSPYFFDQEGHVNDYTARNYLMQTVPINSGSHEGWTPLCVAKHEYAQNVAHELLAYEPAYEPHSTGLFGSNLPNFEDGIFNSGFPEGPDPGITAMLNNMAVNSIPSEINPNDEIKDKGNERRQRRMIKNRESAARSRAKKQAYIKLLEEKVKQQDVTIMKLQEQLQVRNQMDVPPDQLSVAPSSSQMDVPLGLSSVTPSSSSFVESWADVSSITMQPITEF